MEVWVDPACSTCRAATAALDEAGVDYTVRLDLEPWDITRTQRPIITADDGTTVVARDPDALARVLPPRSTP